MGLSKDTDYVTVYIPKDKKKKLLEMAGDVTLSRYAGKLLLEAMDRRSGVATEVIIEDHTKDIKKRRTANQ